MRRTISFTAIAVTMVLGCLDAREAHAEGRRLDGRMAPEMTFPTGVNGVASGTSLSSFRGKVVWVKFVLRDCPRCRKTLPRAQELHERWGGSGLVVLVVMHKHGPEQFRSLMSGGGYTFRVGTDPTGALAQRYGVGHRPTDYVIGADGRVKASNGAPDTVIRRELGHHRLALLGTVPPELASVRDAVWNWDYATALRTAEPAATKADASAAVKATTARVQEIARGELDARMAYAARLARSGRTAQARRIVDRVAEHFRGTSLETAAADARRAFLASTGR